MDNALKAKQNQEWPASNRALELLGKELGMFVERVWQLPPNMEDWPEAIQKAVIDHLNALVEAEDRAKLETQKQLTGPVVDIQATEGS
jgi:hypothetical protein